MCFQSFFLKGKPFTCLISKQRAALLKSCARKLGNLRNLEKRVGQRGLEVKVYCLPRRNVLETPHSE